VAIQLARTPPWTLVARKYKRTYDRFRKLKEENDWNRNTVKTVRKEEEEKMLESWKSSLRQKITWCIAARRNSSGILRLDY